MNRRGFLQSAAAALPAGVVMAGSLAQASEASENPELLRLGAALDDAEAVFLAADRAKRDAVAVYKATAPSVPDDLVLTRDDQRWFLGEYETDAEGKTVYPAGPHPARRISTAHNLRIEVQDYGARSKLGRIARRRLPIAESYEAALNAARESSGVGRAIEARYFAGVEVQKLASKIFAEAAGTLQGVAIKARAITVCAAMGEVERMQAGFTWGVPLAEALSTMMGGSLASSRGSFPQPA